MKAPTPTRRQLLAAGLAAGALARPAQAAFPERPLRWIVGFPPGGGTDLFARLLGQAIAPELGQAVVIENRPGAAGSLGAEALARSAPEGHTVASTDNGILIINPLIYRRVSYDPERDFRPVGLYAHFHLGIAVRADSPIRSFAEFLQFARTSRESVSYGSPGIGSPLHLAMERLGHEVGLRLNHVPYRGAGPAVNDLVAGHVGVISTDYTPAAEMIRAGRVRLLALYSEARAAFLPDVPTVAETVPGFVATAWQGMIVPRATPDAIVNRLSALLTGALAAPAVRARYASLGVDAPTAADPTTFARRWEEDKAVLQPAIRSLGVRLDE